MLSTLLIGLSLGATIASAAPGPISLGSDLSILVHNDLYGVNSTRSQALLIASTPQTLTSARSTCSELGESLWTPQADDFLPYLAYSNGNVSALYWAGTGCVNVTVDGLGSDVEGGCDDGMKLEVICSNSAPRSSAGKVDNSTYWQVQVKTEDNWVTGFRDKDVFRFEGVRYAAQPERFTYSTPFVTTDNTTALSFGSACLQAPNVGSEDCLFLNIWTPFLPSSTSNTTLKPVMFQIHGGAFTGGTGSDTGLDGTALASRGDVVVVTINYRLTTLGFLALEDGVTNGNYGLGDQVTALDWVHAHIRAFGGDPDRITILGQSAGAASVRALLASPKAIGKFAGAIPQSNLAGSAYATTYSEYYNISQQYQVAAVPILNATGCLNATSQVECLRLVDPFVLANLSTVARFIVQDGEYIVTPRLEVTGKGPAANVPVKLGFMRDDGASFISYPKAGTTNVSAELANSGFTTQQLSASTLELYPLPDSANATTNLYNASAALATDAEFRCLDIATAYSASTHDVWPATYFYEFNRSYNGYDPNPPVCEAPVTVDFPYGDPSQEYFKCHSGELNYVFGSIAYNGGPDRDGLDTPMSQFAVDTWTSFARTGNPNIDVGFLHARGFVNTTRQVETTTKWGEVAGANFTVRIMQYPAYQAEKYQFSSAARCEAVGFPVGYYESL